MLEWINKKIVLFRADLNLQEVVRGGIIALALRITGSGLGFLFNLVIARILGAEGAGIYFLALSVTVIGSVIGRVGLDNALLRMIATEAANGQWDKVNRIHVMGFRIVIAVSLPLSVLGFISSDWISSLFGRSELAEPLRWMSLSILPLAILYIQAASLKGLKRIRDALLIEGVGVPLLALLFVWPLANWSGVIGVSAGYLGAATIVSTLGIWAWKHALPNGEGKKNLVPLSKLTEICKPLFIISLITEAVLPWSSIFLVGIWATNEEVGIFGAATRVAVLISFLMITLNNVIAPKFAELYARSDIDALEILAQRTAKLLVLVVSPLFIALFFFSEEIMSIFGPEFTGGGAVLAVLAVGRFVNLITGPVGYMLMMTGHEKIMRNITITSAVIQVSLVFILTPVFGVIGAAIASATALIFVNMMSAYFVYRKLGILTIPIYTRAF